MVQKIKYLSFIIASFFIVFQLMAQVAGKDSVIRVGIFQDQPKLYFDDEKKPAGIFVELIEEVAKNDHSNLNWIILVTAIVFLTGVTFAFLIFLINRKDRDLSQTNQFLNREEHKFRSYIENAPYGVFVANEKRQFTDEKITQSRLNWYGQIFNQSINEIYLFDTKRYRFAQVNGAALKNTGYTLSENLEMSPLDLKLEHEIKEQTEELQNRVTELEQFREVTIERELRMEQLRREIEMLKKLNVEK